MESNFYIKFYLKTIKKDDKYIDIQDLKNDENWEDILEEINNYVEMDLNFNIGEYSFYFEDEDFSLTYEGILFNYENLAKNLVINYNKICSKCDYYCRGNLPNCENCPDLLENIPRQINDQIKKIKEDFQIFVDKDSHKSHMTVLIFKQNSEDDLNFDLEFEYKIEGYYIQILN